MLPGCVWSCLFDTTSPFSEIITVHTCSYSLLMHNLSKRTITISVLLTVKLWKKKRTHDFITNQAFQLITCGLLRLSIAVSSCIWLVMKQTPEIILDVHVFPGFTVNYEPHSNLSTCNTIYSKETRLISSRNKDNWSIIWLKINSPFSKFYRWWKIWKITKQTSNLRMSTFCATTG